MEKEFAMLSTLPKPRSRRRPIVRNEEVTLVLMTSIGAVVEYIRRDNPTLVPAEFGSCVCAKCRTVIDPVDECLFFKRRGGPHDGLSMAGHRRCVPTDQRITVSRETALQILLRQSK